MNYAYDLNFHKNHKRKMGRIWRNDHGEEHGIAGYLKPMKWAKWDRETGKGIRKRMNLGN